MGNGALYMEDEEKKKVKICTKCKTEKPTTLDFFPESKQLKSGLASWCRDCKKEETKKWREENPEKLKDQRKKYHDKNNKNQYPLQRLHLKIKKLKSKQKYCSICNQKKKLELSSIGGKYSENPNNYWWLCHECHALYDRINKTHKKIIKEV